MISSFIHGAQVTVVPQLDATTANISGALTVGSVNGTNVLSGTGAPGSGLGVVGDVYADLSSGEHYEKTGSSTWTRLVKAGDAVTGTSVNGITFLTGSADPSSGGGVAAAAPAYYTRTGTADIYLKTGSGDTAWTKVVKSGDAASLGVTTVSSLNGLYLYTGSADPTAGGGVAHTEPALYFRTGTDQVWIATGSGATAWTRIDTTSETAVNGVTILTGAGDPSSGGGQAATRPAVYVRTGTDQLWLKTGAGDTAWTRLADTVDLALKAPAASPSFTGPATFSGPVESTASVLTSSGASIAIDASLASYYTHAATENTTIANPTNPVAGMQFTIAFTQHASSAKSLAFGTFYSFGAAGAPDFLDMGLSKVGYMTCVVRDTTHVDCTWAGGF